MRLVLLFFFVSCISLIFSSPSPSSETLVIDRDEDCQNIDRTTAGLLVKFSSQVAYGQDSCSLNLHNQWFGELQHGFGVFLPKRMDCGSIVTVECLPDSVLSNQSLPDLVQYTCHTSADRVELPCSSIRLTYKRDIRKSEEKKSTYVQVVALAEGPCHDHDVFFACKHDYPQSCIDTHFQCNGRSECPSGDDERDCHVPSPAGTSILVIVLVVLALLSLLCILSAVLVCCCCRAAVNGLIRRVRSAKRDESTQKGDVTLTGEDAGLIKGLTGPSTMVEMYPPQARPESGALMIDSTKPIYPRLE